MSQKRRSRGPKGAGSIFPDRRRGGYVVKIPDGRNADGKLKYKYLHAKTQGEAVKLRDKHKPQTAGPNLTLAEWYPKWTASMAQKLQSRDVYEQCFRLRILPALGKRPLAAITTFEVEECSRKWLTQCAARTVIKTLAALSACLQAAHRHALVPANVVRPAKKPTEPKVEFDLFTREEMRLILEAALKDPMDYPLAVCAAFGCRIGEALAVGPDGYDAATGMLTFDRTRTRTRGYSSPKSRHSLRTVRAPLQVRPALAAGVPSYTHTTAGKRWAALLKRLGLRQRGTHQMRHTLASHWHAAGVPAAEIARYLGDTVQTVIETYCHATPGGADPSAVTERWLQGGGKVAQGQKAPAKRR